MRDQWQLTNSACAIALLALSFTVASAVAGRADEPRGAGEGKAKPKVEEPKEGDPASKPARDDAQRAGELGHASSYWIGVALAGEEELRVVDVVPDGPGDKAGLQTGDVIEAYGEQAVNALSELVAAIDEGKRQVTQVKVRRGDEELKLELKPERRPAPGQNPRFTVPFRPGEPLDVEKLREALRQWGVDREGMPEQAWEWYRLPRPFVTPDNWTPATNFPKRTSVTVTRDEDERLTIRVEHDGKTHEITDQQLDQLPGHLRRAVQQMLGGPFVGASRPPAFVPPQAPGTPPRVVVPQPAFPRPRAPRREDAADERDETLKTLQREIEALRRDVQQLKQDRDAEQD